MGNNPSALSTCLADVCAGRAGCSASPSTPLYQLTWVKPFNLDVPVEPAAVIRPRNSAEVAGAVKCAVKHGVRVQAKSGGHSYANYGLGGEDGSLVVDLVNLDSFSMDQKTWQATVGAGTRLGKLDEKLHGAGKRAVAHGVCPGVGIGGHATIGGLGPSSRMWGTCLDHVVEVEVVTATGEVVRANENKNADLFWALRGAGASFGIITEFVLRTHPEPGSVVQHTFSFSLGSAKEMAPIYEAWQALIADPDLDRRFATEFVVQPLGAIITTTFFGTEAEWDATGIADRIPNGGDVKFVVNDWLASLIQEAGNEALYLGDIPTPFYSKALALAPDDLLGSQSIASLFDYIDGADKGTLLWFVIFDASGGAVNDVPLAATAYPHRDKLLFYQSYAVGLGALADETTAFLEGVHAEIEAGAPGANSTYAGYVDPAIGREEAEWAYWEGQVPLLREVKREWDPKGVFWNPGGVRVV
ncbi:related to reticuline oxidase (berberine bridge enzyme) [Cephalotrichum gorgonifer]|uniref:Related to reticuline oxidase (Berberine bridge enzyme) n=1 Tax=Cephalotrichum gorgonifer TaxID=2041049 RepID=A0AAE8N499_9PEZI|nr:related to reticuline oxidase (berberine bridge enzyme) [Cephalotrichum gorgonifer]